MKFLFQKNFSYFDCLCFAAINALIATNDITWWAGLGLVVVCMDISAFGQHLLEYSESRK
jgi:hypothetical protein